MTTGIDYASGRPAPAAIVKAGHTMVARYLSRSGWKVLDSAERDALLAAGLDIVLVFEDGASNALQGAKRGQPDGAFAAGMAASLGAPRGMVLYFAVDTDTNDFAAVNAYLAAADAECRTRGYRAGVYGSYEVCRHALADGKVATAWQTGAWSGGKRLAEAALYQHIGYAVIDGVQCDVDDIQHPYGGWRTPLEPHAIRKPVRKPSRRLFVPKTTKRGQSGRLARWRIRLAQRRLNRHGQHLTIDGEFGPHTEAAVRDYQHTHGLAADGVIGPRTWRSLLAK